MADTHTPQAANYSFAGVTTSVREEVDITWKIENFEMVVQSNSIYVRQVLQGGGHIYVNALTHFYTFPVGSSKNSQQEVNDKVMLKFELTVQKLQKKETDYEDDDIVDLSVTLLNKNSCSIPVLLIFNSLKILKEGETVKLLTFKNFLDMTILSDWGWSGIIRMSEVNKYLDDKGSLTFQMKILHFKPPSLLLPLQQPGTGPYVTSFDQIQKGLESLFGDEMKCDVEIHVTETETSRTKSFFAHKEILAARSTVFKAMFYGSEMRESFAGVVEVSDISVKTMDLFLNFIYTGCFEDILTLMEMLCELLYAADKFDVKTLRDVCKENIIRNLKPINAMDLYAVCQKHALHDTTSQVLRFIVRNIYRRM